MQTLLKLKKYMEQSELNPLVHKLDKHQQKYFFHKKLAEHYNKQNDEKQNKEHKRHMNHHYKKATEIIQKLNMPIHKFA